jgi:hypothetical protein
MFAPAAERAKETPKRPSHTAYAPLGRALRADGLDVRTRRGYASGMSQAAHQHNDSPEVAALRKKIRGEPLTDDERQLLARQSREPTGASEAITQEQLSALLAERMRRGE